MDEIRREGKSIVVLWEGNERDFSLSSLIFSLLRSFLGPVDLKRKGETPFQNAHLVRGHLLIAVTWSVL